MIGLGETRTAIEATQMTESTHEPTSDPTDRSIPDWPSPAAANAVMISEFATARKVTPAIFSGTRRDRASWARLGLMYFSAVLESRGKRISRNTIYPTI